MTRQLFMLKETGESCGKTTALHQVTGNLITYPEPGIGEWKCLSPLSYWDRPKRGTPLLIYCGPLDLSRFGTFYYTEFYDTFPRVLYFLTLILMANLANTK